MCILEVGLIACNEVEFVSCTQEGSLVVCEEPAPILASVTGDVVCHGTGFGVEEGSLEPVVDFLCLVYDALFLFSETETDIVVLLAELSVILRGDLIWLGFLTIAA